MQNENSEAQNGQPNSTADNTRIKDDLTQLEHEIHDALVDGVNIRETVHNLTLRALNADRLNIDSIRRITTAVVNGVHEGAQKQLVAPSNQTEAAKSQITEAVSGLDSALARVAEATKLAMQEAAGRAHKFSDKELVRTKSDLEGLESILLDTLQNTASATKGVLSDILHDIATHAKNNGTVVGAQLKETLAIFAQQAASIGHVQLDAGAHLAQSTADFIQKIASGVLSGIKDHTQPKK